MSGRAFSLVTFSLRAQRESNSPGKGETFASKRLGKQLGAGLPGQEIAGRAGLSGDRKRTGPARFRGRGLPAHSEAERFDQSVPLRWMLVQETLVHRPHRVPTNWLRAVVSPISL